MGKGSRPLHGPFQLDRKSFKVDKDSITHTFIGSSRSINRYRTTREINLCGERPSTTARHACHVPHARVFETASRLRADGEPRIRQSHRSRLPPVVTMSSRLLHSKLTRNGGCGAKHLSTIFPNPGFLDDGSPRLERCQYLCCKRSSRFHNVSRAMVCLSLSVRLSVAARLLT